MRPLQKIRSLPWSRLLPPIGLGVLIFLTLVINFHWIQTDGRLGATLDPKNYILKTFVFTSKMESSGWDKFFPGLKSLSLSGRPPLYQLLSVPFLISFGYSMDVGLMVNMLFQVLLLFSVFKIGQIIRNGYTGLLASFLVAVYPPIIQLAREYRPHFAIPASIAFSLWMLLSLMKRRTIKAAWEFVLSLGFGALIHSFFVTMVFIPAAVFSFYIIFFQVAPHKPTTFRDLWPWLWGKLKNPLFLYGYLPSALLVGGVVAGWYFSFGLHLFAVLQTINSDELAEFRGVDVFTKGFRDIPSGFFWYLRTMPYAISNVLTVFFGIGAAGLLIKRKPENILLLTSFIGAYVYLATLSTKTWMHFAGILPIMAAMTAVGIAEFKSKKASYGFVILIIIVGGFIYSTVNWGTGETGLKIADILGAPLTKGNCVSADQVFCPRPPQEMAWPIKKIVEAAVGDVQSNEECEERCSVLIINNSGDFNAPVFNYYLWMEKADPKREISFVRLEAGVFNIKLFNYDRFLNSTYIVYIDPAKTSGTKYDVLANAFLATPPPSFTAAHQTVNTFELQDGAQRINLIKRIKPLTLVEARDAVRLMDLDEKYTGGQYRVFASLYVEAGQLENALDAYLQAIEYEPLDASLFFEVAGVYESLGQLDHASSAYRQVVALAPRSKWARLAQAWLDAR